MGRGARRDRGALLARAAPAETILNAHYTGTFALLGYGFPLRFFHRLGATEVDPDTICNKAGHVALDYLYGSSEDGFDPRSARDAACILVWGANPSVSAPHQHDHWLPEAPGTTIVVDPVATPTAAGRRPAPGAVPGLGRGAGVRAGARDPREGLLDRALLADHAVGFDELEPRLGRARPPGASA